MLDEEEVWRMHSQGKTASEIDAKLMLEPGTAARIIARLWRIRAEEERAAL